MISPHHFHPTNGVRPSDSDGFSTDYPSVMFSVIRKLKERK